MSDAADDLAALRGLLDGIDADLVGALAERQRVVERIGDLKAGGRTRLRDVPREEQLLTRLVRLGRERGLDRHFVVRIYQEILEQSVRRQQEKLVGRDNPARAEERPIVVTYLGSEGSYSHQAATRHFGGRTSDVALRGGANFAALVESVRRGTADYAVLPIENTTAGSINEVYDLLANEPVHIVGEEIQPVEHALLGHADTEVAEIQRILGHPQAIAQCSRFLARMSHCAVEAVADTATGVRRVVESEEPGVVAIANSIAARRYGLEVLWPAIANQEQNLTRFVVVASEPQTFDARIPCKTSLSFAVSHEQGALLGALEVLHAHGANLTKLESRPLPGEPWSYRFYVDFVGASDPGVQTELVRELGPRTSGLLVLGTYPAKTGEVPAEPRADD